MAGHSGLGDDYTLGFAFTCDAGIHAQNQRDRARQQEATTNTKSILASSADLQRSQPSLEIILWAIAPYRHVPMIITSLELASPKVNIRCRFLGRATIRFWDHVNRLG